MVNGYLNSYTFLELIHLGIVTYIHITRVSCQKGQDTLDKWIVS